jgi:hypothetical protein
MRYLRTRGHPSSRIKSKLALIMQKEKKNRELSTLLLRHRWTYWPETFWCVWSTLLLRWRVDTCTQCDDLLNFDTRYDKNDLSLCVGQKSSCRWTRKKCRSVHRCQLSNIIALIIFHSKEHHFSCQTASTEKTGNLPVVCWPERQSWRKCFWSRSN